MLHAPGRLGSRTRTLHDNRNPLARPRPSDLRPFAAHFKGGEFWSHLVCSSGTHTLVTAAHSMHLRHTHTHTHWSLQDIVCTSGTHIGHCSTLYAPQTHKLVTAGHCMHLKAHTMVTAAPCMHLTHTHTHQSMQHTVQPAITLNSAFTCPVLLSQQTVITTPKQQLRHILVNETQCFQ